MLEETNIFKNNYEYLVSQLNWYDYPLTQPNSNNYRNYPDGIYVDGKRAVPLFNTSTSQDFRDYNAYIMNNFVEEANSSENPNRFLEIVQNNFRSFTYEFKDNSLKNINDSFTKIKSSDMLYNYFPLNEYILDFYDENQNVNSCLFRIPITISTKVYNKIDNNYHEISTYDYNRAFDTFVYPVRDSNTDEITYALDDFSFEKYAHNMEEFSIVLLESNFELINTIVALYTYIYANGLINGKNNIPDIELYSELDDMITFLADNDIGYFNFKKDSNGKYIISDRFKEYAKYLKFDLDSIDKWKNKYESVQNDEEHNLLLKEYYDYYGVDYYTDQHSDHYLLGKPLLRILTEDAVIVHNGKFYSGETGFYKWLADYLGKDDVNEFVRTNNLASSIDDINESIYAQTIIDYLGYKCSQIPNPRN